MSWVVRMCICSTMIVVQVSSYTSFVRAREYDRERARGKYEGGGMEHAKGEEEGTRVGPGEGADAGGEVGGGGTGRVRRSLRSKKQRHSDRSGGGRGKRNERARRKTATTRLGTTAGANTGRKEGDGGCGGG